MSNAKAEETAAVLGIFPYVSATKLAEFHEPLRRRLEQTIGRPVTMVTAPDIPEFIKRTADGAYDYVLTAPHVGWIAESRNDYHNLVGSEHRVQGVFLASNRSTIFTLADLKGKTITLPSPMSIVYQLGMHELRKAGLEPGKNITIVVTKTHNNAMYAPARNESDASLTGILMWEKIGVEYWDKLRVIGNTEKAPGFFFLSHKRVGDKERVIVRDSLLSFSRDRRRKPGSAMRERAVG